MPCFGKLILYQYAVNFAVLLHFINSQDLHEEGKKNNAQVLVCHNGKLVWKFHGILFKIHFPERIQNRKATVQFI